MAAMERREEMRRLLGRREREGLTFVELAQQTGIPVGTLASWAWKLRREGGGSRAARSRGHAPGFVELVPGPEIDGDRVHGAGAFEVVLMNGRRVLVREGFDEERFVRLVQALERC
jgi:hypothetical protein